MWPFLSLDVLHVGDGACSVITESLDERMILDCGSWRSSGRPQAQILAHALGRKLRSAKTLAVSHFDADHWKGLAALPSEAPRANLPQQVRIRYPGLPRLAQETTAAYLALRAVDEGVSLRAQDLIAAWKTVAEVDAEPLFAGSELLLGDMTFDVVWPPRDLPRSWSAAAQRTLDELTELAEQIPALARALDEAYQDAWPGAGQQAAREEGWGYDQEVGYLAGTAGDEEPEPIRTADNPELPPPPGSREDLEAGVAWDLAGEGVWGDELPPHPENWEPLDPRDDRSPPNSEHGLPENWRQGHDQALDGQPGGQPVEDLPGPRVGPGHSGHTEMFGPEKIGMPHRERLRDLARRLGVLNNHLSLVLAEQQTGFVALGDAQGWSLRHVGRELLKIQSSFDLALAPHHGTVRMPPEFPEIGVCVLQNGPSHLTRAYRHLSSHGCGFALSTEVSGNLRVPWWPI